MSEFLEGFELVGSDCSNLILQYYYQLEHTTRFQLTLDLIPYCVRNTTVLFRFGNEELYESKFWSDPYGFEELVFWFEPRNKLIYYHEYFDHTHPRYYWYTIDDWKWMKGIRYDILDKSNRKKVMRFLLNTLEASKMIRIIKIPFEDQ